MHCGLFWLKPPWPQSKMTQLNFSMEPDRIENNLKQTTQTIFSGVTIESCDSGAKLEDLSHRDETKVGYPKGSARIPQMLPFLNANQYRFA